jgi:type II secretory pathway pseudopilin PulG
MVVRERTSLSVQRAGEAGFTLMELLFATAVSLVVAGVVMQMFIQMNAAYGQARQVIDRRNNAAAATDMIVRLLRMAQTVHPDPDGNTVMDSVRIVADWNPRDGDTLDAYEDVRFTVVGDQLLKREPADAAAIPFADNVANIAFTYRSPTGALIANPVAANPNLLAHVRMVLTTTPVEGRPAAIYSAAASVRRTE